MSELVSQNLSVSEAIKLFNVVLAEMRINIEGEVANYSVSRGQFVFFDLKDEEHEARLSCFMMLAQQNVPLEDGMRIVVSGKPTVFVKSGKFSITVQRIEPKGEGSVKRAFELLRKKLQEEGLFAEERKRRLPKYPHRVGIISSTEAAGYGDFMRIIDSRLAGVTFTTAHVAVQGKDAEEEICAAFDHLNSHYDLDCIVLIRGGGSMEDLHAFNSEFVARAIVRSKAPVLVGVGHERDITIADYCADLRASTPSNAAQLLLPTVEEVSRDIWQLLQQGQALVTRRIDGQRSQVMTVVVQSQQRLQHMIEQARHTVESAGRSITALSPAATLQRGYSITWTMNGDVVRSVAGVAPAATLRTQLSDGDIISITTQS